MINYIKKTRIYTKIKPPFVWLYNKIYDIYTNFLMVKDNILKNFKPRPQIMSIDESIDYIRENKCSLSRYGDGELKIISGSSIDFQDYSDELRDRLKEVFKSTNKKHIIGIPNVFGSLKIYEYEPKKYWRRHLSLYRKEWYRLICMNKKYVNSFLSRPYMIYTDKSKSLYYFKKVTELWEGKDIVIIEGAKSRLGVGNDLFNNVNTIQRILVPNKNAYSSYKELLELCKSIKKDKMILLAIGPTATVLAYDLCKIGYQAIDIGHIDIEYEWFLQNAENKVAIKYKYVGEAIGGQDVEDLLNEKYNSEIIASI